MFGPGKVAKIKVWIAAIVTVDAPHCLAGFECQDKFKGGGWCQMHPRNLKASEEIVSSVVMKRKRPEVLVDDLGLTWNIPNVNVDLGTPRGRRPGVRQGGWHRAPDAD